MSDFKCPKCGRLVEYNRTSCESGHFIGFPNVRRAEEMRADLLRHYDAALDDARRRGVTAQVRQLETILQDSIATINVDAKLLSNMAKSQNYMSYYNAIALGRGCRNSYGIRVGDSQCCAQSRCSRSDELRRDYLGLTNGGYRRPRVVDARKRVRFLRALPARRPRC